MLSNLGCRACPSVHYLGIQQVLKGERQIWVQFKDTEDVPTGSSMDKPAAGEYERMSIPFIYRIVWS